MLLYSGSTSVAHQTVPGLIASTDVHWLYSCPSYTNGKTHGSGLPDDSVVQAAKENHKLNILNVCFQNMDLEILLELLNRKNIISVNSDKCMIVQCSAIIF